MTDDFARRHIGPTDAESKEMLKTIGFDDFDSMVKSTVPANILADKPLDMEPAMTETEAVAHLKKVRHWGGGGVGEACVHAMGEERGENE